MTCPIRVRQPVSDHEFGMLNDLRAAIQLESSLENDGLIINMTAVEGILIDRYNRESSAHASPGETSSRSEADPQQSLYPAYPMVIANEALALTGSGFFLGEQAPLVMLVWGAQRVLPVQIERISARDLAFDAQLNPIRVEVDPEARVLTYRDLDPTNPGSGGGELVGSRRAAQWFNIEASLGASF